jgi:hypothetical protein
LPGGAVLGVVQTLLMVFFDYLPDVAG